MHENTNKTQSNSILWKRSKLMKVDAIQNNPLAPGLLDKFSIGNKVDVNALSTALYSFINTSDSNKKLRFIFDCYDEDKDGYISRAELLEFLRQLNRKMLSNWKIQNIVDRTFADIGEYKVSMDFDDFKNMVNKTNMFFIQKK